MRTFIFSLVLLLVLVTGLVFYDRYLYSESENLVSLVDALSAAAEEEDWEESERAMARLHSEWEKASPRLASFTDHALLDDILITTAAASGFLRMREGPELVAEAKTLRALAEHIHAREKLSLYNIF